MNFSERNSSAGPLLVRDSDRLVHGTSASDFCRFESLWIISDSLCAEQLTVDAFIGDFESSESWDLVSDSWLVLSAGGASFLELSNWRFFVNLGGSIFGCGACAKRLLMALKLKANLEAEVEVVGGGGFFGEELFEGVSPESIREDEHGDD